MYLKKTPQKNGRIFLSIVDGYYDKKKGYSRQVTIKKLGYLDELKKQYEDPIEFFSQKVYELKTIKAERKAAPRSIQVTSTTGKKLKKTVHEKQVVFYSEKYDKKAKAERALVIAKAQELIANPSKFTRATSHGAAGYIKNIDFDKETGEILNTTKALQLDLEKLKEEEALDGYYVIITSEYEETADRIIDMYRGLWRIEESYATTL